MKGALVQYIAGAILLIMVFLLVSDPNATVAIFGAMASANTGAINTLQGKGAPARVPWKGK